jgi:tRNA(Ile)-lysidine synthase
VTGARLVFLAHTADDQVETLLMRYLRGSGPAGLAGMPVRRGPWVRPLLDVSRQQLATFLTERRIEFWSDPANEDPKHLRSWIRHTLLPVVEERLPRARRELLAARAEYVDNRAALDELVRELALNVRAEVGGLSVAVAPLRRYSSTVVRVLLRTLGRRCDLALGRDQVDRLQVLLEQGSTGQRVDLKGGAWAELGFGRLHLMAGVGHPTSEAFELDSVQGARTFGPWRVVWQPDIAPSATLDRRTATTWIEPGASIRVRRWTAGDRIRPVGGRGRRLVVRCMQEARVPRHRRPEWPVFESGGEVIWVPSVCRSDARLPEPGAPVTRIDVSAS